mmetsp:Transcript_44108/g.143452  ORF Transcript_44108/g.143452 Transcript_44108/m.143452 type:complete len:232 (+) Transcript_44108:246-941(+)
MSGRTSRSTNLICSSPPHNLSPHVPFCPAFSPARPPWPPGGACGREPGARPGAPATSTPPRAPPRAGGRDGANRAAAPVSAIACVGGQPLRPSRAARAWFPAIRIARRPRPKGAPPGRRAPNTAPAWPAWPAWAAPGRPAGRRAASQRSRPARRRGLPRRWSDPPPPQPRRPDLAGRSRCRSRYRPRAAPAPRGACRRRCRAAPCGRAAAPGCCGAPSPSRESRPPRAPSG